MMVLDEFFNPDYFELLIQLLPVSFLLGCLLTFAAWGVGMGFLLFARILRS